MKITRTEIHAAVHEVSDVASEITSVPSWLGMTMRQTCDACRFPMAHSQSIQAIRCESGKVLVIHAACLKRLSA